MKKTIIALALAALPVAAIADVTLFGKIKGGLDFTKTKNVETTETKLADWGSTIGFKGSEDLGKGLKAIWQLKQKASFAGGDAGWSTSESYLGLVSPAGTLKVGNIGDNIKTGMGDVDPWIGNIGLGLTSGVRQVAARYDTPDFSEKPESKYKFNANLYISPEDNNRGSSGEGTTVYAAGLNYTYGGFYAKYGFELFHKTGSNDDGQVHALEAGYNANNLFVGVGVQFNKDHTFDPDALAAAQKYARDNGMPVPTALEPSKYIQAAATASYTLGNVTPRISYAHGFKKDDKGGYDKVILGADYALSNRTTAAVAVGWDRKDSKDQTYRAEVGVEHKF